MSSWTEVSPAVMAKNLHAFAPEHYGLLSCLVLAGAGEISPPRVAWIRCLMGFSLKPGANAGRKGGISVSHKTFSSHYPVKRPLIVSLGPLWLAGGNPRILPDAGPVVPPAAFQTTEARWLQAPLSSISFSTLARSAQFIILSYFLALPVDAQVTCLGLRGPVGGAGGCT